MFAKSKTYFFCRRMKKNFGVSLSGPSETTEGSDLSEQWPDKKLNSSMHQHLQKKQLKLPTIFTKPHYPEQPTRIISPPLHKWATANILAWFQFAHRAVRSALWVIFVESGCWPIMHPLRSSRWEAGQRQAEREQAGGSRETGRLKQAMGTTGIWATCHNVHLEKSHFRSVASCCESIRKAMRWGQPQQQQQQQKYRAALCIINNKLFRGLYC